MGKRIPHSQKLPARKRILVVDDHPMTREGLRGVINREPDFTVCGEAANANQAIEAVQKLAPDLVLTDITLPGKSGLELVKDLKAIQPLLKILSISMHEESLYAERMLRAGANGYITKQEPAEELVRAIRMVFDGHIYVSKEVSEGVLRRFSGQPRSSRSPIEILTDREFEIFQLLGKGAAAKEIAGQLHVSAKTVAVHNANIRKKLNLGNSSQLIRFAVQWEK
jgi:DNA-binding NarL/FixJ family response regulator